MQTAYLNFKKITDQKDLRGKRILLRLDLNVPIVGNEVRDDFRIKKIIPTLEFLRDAGAKTIIASHIESELTNSLSRVATYISNIIPLKAFIAKLDEAKSVIDVMRDGEIVMLENLRQNPGEKENSPVFAGRLAALGDIFVNDAFSVSHRDHASISTLPRVMKSYAGPLFAQEVTALSKAFNPPKPFLFIIGGAKFDTKLPLVEKFLDIAEYVFIGGALANDIFKEKGYEVGRSVVAKSPINLKHVENNPRLLIPLDVVAASDISKSIKTPDTIGPDEKISDVGPKTIDQIADLLNDIKFVIWNGPLGNYEKDFGKGTEDLVRAIVESRVETIIGGGDTVAIVSKMGLLDKFSFVSTGGGAMVEFLAKGTLPGIEALTKQVV